MTYYQPLVFVNDCWEFPEDLLYSFQVFASVDECKKFMMNNGYSFDEINVVQYNGNDIEEPTFIDCDGNVI